MNVMANCYATLAELSRKDMRHFALEYRRAIARGDQVQARMWLAFAIYDRAVMRECLMNEPVPTELIRAVDEIIMKMAAHLY